MRKSTVVTVGEKFGERVVIAEVQRRTGKRLEAVFRCDADLSTDCVKEAVVHYHDLTRKKNPTKTCRPCAYAYTTANKIGVKRVPPKFIHTRPSKPMALPPGIGSAAAAILRGAYSRGAI